VADVLERLRSALADRYVIERELGRGGMATVYLAQDRKLGRPVALKVLKPELAAALGSERFLREIEIAARLTHPNILGLYDCGTTSATEFTANGRRLTADLLYYTMPFVEGESLRDRLTRERQLPLDDALQITREVADALGYAHSLGLVHRDIKPENILFQAGHALVADFGIARAVSAAGGTRLTETGLAIGTPAYMSPEQAAGNPALDGRSDLYSLGCVLYEMLTGETPYTGPTPQAILAKKLSEPLPCISVVREAVPTGVEATLNKALGRTPANRFGTTQEFAEALTRASTAEAIAVQARRPRTARNRRAALAAAAVVVLAVLGWWGGKMLAGAGAPGIRSLAVLPLQNLSGDTAQDYFVLGMTDALIGELDQITALQVISRTSAMTYQGTHKTVPEIARELNVDGIVEGSVLREGDSVRVRVQLIRARPHERSLWGQTYLKDIRDVLGLHSEVALAVAREVRVKLTPAQASQLGGARRVNRETYEAYLRGMYLLDRGTPADYPRALAILRGAIEYDPADPLAYAGLAAGYVTILHGPAPPLDALPLAREAAERALRLDSTLTEAMAALAFLKGYFDWDWGASDSLFRRAIALNPSLAMAHYWYAWQLALFDQMDSAIAEHKRAQAADPLNPLHSAWLGQLYIRAGRYEDAMAEARRAIALDPRHPVAHWVLAQVYVAQGRNDAAMAEARRAAEADSAWVHVVGVIAARTGRVAEARRIAAALERQPVSPWNAYRLVVLYATLGDNDRAFRWLNYEHPHAWVPWVRVSPWNTTLRDDPRFPALLRKMNLPARPTSPRPVARMSGEPADVQHLAAEPTTRGREHGSSIWTGREG
jgi:TolB-like protein